MKSVYEADAAAEIRRRIQSVSANSPRQWGKMTPAQMLAHCAVSLSDAVGDTKPPRMFIGRLLGGMIKKKALSEGPMSKNAPTAPTYHIADDRDVEVEKAKLLSVYDRFVVGPQACTDHPHTFFGRMSADEWGRLVYKHLDHHLAQFSA